MAGHVVRMAEMTPYNILVGNLKGRCTWEDNIKMNVTEVGCET
jgi:hypothetical protein